MSTIGRRGKKGRRLGATAPRPVLTCLVLAAMLLAVSAIAAGAEVSRESYREAVEPICKINTQTNERIFKGVRAEVRHNQLKPAALAFEKAAKALKRTLAQLKAVPQPSADKAKLAKWLGFVKAEADRFEAVAAQLRAGKKIAAEREVVKLTGNANRANNVVIGFEFEYCRFEPSRFT
jgi:hypothetical protein